MYKMEIFLDDTNKVFFPGTVIYGVLCVQECANVDLNHEPVISTNGYTIIWKPGTNKDTDDYVLFYEDKAALSLESENTNISLNNELIKDYSKIFYFHIVLPNNLPPSHEVPFGHTRYKFVAYYNGQTVFKYYSVNQWVGLEKRNNLIVKNKQFTPSLFNFCQKIEIQLMIDQSYYLSGETLYVGVVTANNSWKNIMFSKMFIIQTTKYWKNHHLLPIKHTRVIVEATRGLVSSGESQIWNKQPLKIPAVIPTTSSSNNPFNFFEVKYKLKMHIVLENSKKKIVLKQKLFIGNWDKNTNINSKQCADTSANNDSPNGITAQKCTLIKSENIDFIPKYIIYETSQQ